MVLIDHPSKLPQNKGFASIQYEILKNKKKFFVSLIKATKKVDAGPICSQEYFTLNGTELLDEIRQKQQSIYFKMIKKFLSKYPKVKFRRQIGEGNFNKKRHSKDSKLDINKTIKSQFNLLRINHNELYPSFFKFKNNKFVIKIYKSKK